MLRECDILMKNPIYLICMVALPLFVIIYFTTLMGQGQPQEMPVGVVDLDNTSTTRALTRKLDAFQTTNIVGHFNSVADARHAMQKSEIYAFIYFPEGTTDKLLSSRRPKISFYYSQTSLTSGSLLLRDLKTISTLGSAAVGQATLRAKGFTDRQIKAFLQPVSIDVHPINNPYVNYNLYLSTMLIPACLMLFIMLLTTYSMGSEVKFGRGKELMERANGNILIALTGKLLPQTLIFLTLMYVHLFYLFDVLNFTHQGGLIWILVLGLLAVLSGQGFGLMIFGACPSMRMSMSICSLWSVLSFSMVGAAYPVFAMDTPLQSLAWLFPLRHYWLIYALNVFNGYPLEDTWMYVGALVLCSALPLLLVGRIKTVLETYVYTK